MWSTSPLLLLLSFSSLCLLSGVLLLDGGWALSSWLSPASPFSATSPTPSPSSLLSPSTASAAATSSSSASPEGPLRLSPLPFTRPSPGLHPHSPSALLAGYQQSAAAATPSSSLSTCAPSLSFSSFLLSSAPGSLRPHHLLPTSDDPSMNPALSWDTGHALLQLLVGLSLSLSLRLSLVLPPSIFPSRPHWDAFLGLSAGERREVELPMEFDQLSSLTLRERTWEQSMEELQPLLTDGARQATLVRLEMPRVQVRDEDTEGWLAAPLLLSSVHAKYCHARIYRPIPIDLFAPQRLSSRPPLLIAVHVECSVPFCSDSSQQRMGYVEGMVGLLLGVRRLLTSALGVDGGLLSFHLFADQSGLPGASNSPSEDAAVQLTAALTTAISSSSQLHSRPSDVGVHLHLHTPSMWAMHHYITADLFIGNLHASHRTAYTLQHTPSHAPHTTQLYHLHPTPRSSARSPPRLRRV